MTLSTKMCKLGSKPTLTSTIVQMKYGSLLYHVAVWQQQNAKVIFFMPTRLGKQKMEGIISSDLQCRYTRNQIL